MPHKITLFPRDVLYFRDGKPLGGAADGNGAQWPFPHMWRAAVLSAFHRSFSDAEICSFAKTHQHPRRKNTLMRDNFELARTKAVFGGTKTLGPFPQKNGKLYFPIPADLVLNERDDTTEVAQLLPTPVPADCDGNLPRPLTHVLWKNLTPTKKTLGRWISADALKEYLRGNIEKISLADNGREPAELLGDDAMFQTEARPGIGIAPSTGTAEDGKFYSTEYLRLLPDVSMLAILSAISVSACGETDLWEKFLEKEKSKPALIFGGQRGMVRIESADGDLPLPASPKIAGTRVKWTLLSPALFNAGWRPTFVDATLGDVRLLRQIPPRETGESREAWRARAHRNAQPISAKLVAARIPKAVPVSGWKINAARNCKDSCSDGGGAPKPTRLLVPAGSVYYFECSSEEDAAALCSALHGKVKSDLLGEAGYGLGVCSEWQVGNDSF